MLARQLELIGRFCLQRLTLALALSFMSPHSSFKVCNAIVISNLWTSSTTSESAVSSLQNLESEQLDNQLLEPAPVPTARPAQAARPQTAAASAMPNVPQGRPAQAAKPAKTQEELELEALEQEMAV